MARRLFLVLFLHLLMVLQLVTLLSPGAAEAAAPVIVEKKRASGLSYGFYKHSCPRVHSIIREKVRAAIKRDPSQAAGILRIMFHDCFVQGCDASILLEKPITEQTATPNNASLRVSSLKLLDKIKETVEVVCPNVVSCADTIALSTAIAIQLVGGPKITLPIGRRDSKFVASNQTVIANIPPPTSNITSLKQNFQNHSLDITDLVALSGAHTIGQAHCRVVDNQISPTFSKDLNPSFAANLSRVCFPANNSRKAKLTVHLDFITKDRFNNNYFKNVLSNTAMFHSDASLLNATDTKHLVQEYAKSQEKFFKQFEVSLVKMSELGVLTGKNGVIRKKCSMLN